MQLTIEPALRLTPPEHDPVYPNVLALRANGNLERELRKAWFPSEKKTPSIVRARIRQTHYKPFSRARLVAEVELAWLPPGRDRQLLFINLYASSARAREKFASQKTGLPCHGPPVMLFGDYQAVAWALPNGPKLDSIGFCLDHAEFAQYLSQQTLEFSGSPRLVRYVPRKRALFHCAPAFYIKLYRRGENELAARNLARVNEAADRGVLQFQVPRLLRHDPLRRAIIMSDLPGTQLTRFFASEAALGQAGRALASLHLSGIQPATAWSAESECKALGRAMLDVKKALPALTESIDALLERIDAGRAELTFDETTPIHANLFGDQILFADDQIGIVDWDDLALGDPLYDVGRLAAHFIFLSPHGSVDPLNAFLCAYGDASKRPLDLKRLRWHVAMALLMRAKISALRTLAPGWIEQVSRAAADAERVIEGEGLP